MDPDCIYYDKKLYIKLVYRYNNKKKIDSRLLFRLAVYYNNVKLIKAFLNKKTLNSSNIYGNTALHYAVFNKNVHITRLLLKNGAIVDIPNINNIKPIHLALNHIKILRLLLKHKSDIKIMFPMANTLLHFLSFDTRYGSLIEYIPDYNVVDIKYNAYGNTPLHIACIYNNIDAVKWLLEKGADLNSFNKLMHTPLIIALHNNSREIVDLIIKYKPKFYEIEFGLDFTLIKKIITYFPDILDIFLVNGLDPDSYYNEYNLATLCILLQSSNSFNILLKYNPNLEFYYDSYSIFDLAISVSSVVYKIEHDNGINYYTIKNNNPYIESIVKYYFKKAFDSIELNEKNINILNNIIHEPVKLTDEIYTLFDNYLRNTSFLYLYDEEKRNIMQLLINDIEMISYMHKKINNINDKPQIRDVFPRIVPVKGL
jgi:ankyrin repeat protein